MSGVILIELNDISRYLGEAYYKGSAGSLRTVVAAIQGVFAVAKCE